MVSLWRGGDGGDGLEEEKTLELRMQSVILVTRVPPTPPPKEWSSLSGGGGEGRNTSDRRTDPKISCICGGTLNEKLQWLALIGINSN